MRCDYCHKEIPRMTGIHEQRVVLHPDNGRCVCKSWKWFCSDECSQKYIHSIPDDIIRNWAKKHGYQDILGVGINA